MLFEGYLRSIQVRAQCRETSHLQRSTPRADSDGVPGRNALQIKPDYAVGSYQLGSLIGREATGHREALEYLLQPAEIDPEEVAIF